MPKKFMGTPPTFLEGDLLMLRLAQCWQDFRATREDLAANLTHRTMDAHAEAAAELRAAFRAFRALLRYLQQTGHIRGGALRKPPGKPTALSLLPRPVIDD